MRSGLGAAPLSALSTGFEAAWARPVHGRCQNRQINRARTRNTHSRGGEPRRLTILMSLAWHKIASTPSSRRLHTPHEEAGYRLTSMS
jgi:hypothetical protein